MALVADTRVAARRKIFGRVVEALVVVVTLEQLRPRNRFGLALLERLGQLVAMVANGPSASAGRNSSAVLSPGSSSDADNAGGRTSPSPSGTRSTSASI